jgi:hypothetical protein
MIFPEGIPVYGDQKFRDKKCPKEGAEQVTFFNQLRKHYPDSFGKIALHARNEGKKTTHQVAKEKSEGMATGACDITIPGNPSFLCELKRTDHTLSALEPGQEPYMLAAKEVGSFVCIALGWQGAWQAFDYWRTHVLRAA